MTSFETFILILHVLIVAPYSANIYLVFHTNLKDSYFYELEILNFLDIIKNTFHEKKTFFLSWKLQTINNNCLQMAKLKI